MTYEIWSTVFCVCGMCVCEGGEREGKAGGVLMKTE